MRLIPALVALTMTGCYAPLEFGVAATLGRATPKDSVRPGVQLRLAHFPTGLIRESLEMPVDAGAGFAWDYDTSRRSDWSFYAQGTGVARRGLCGTECVAPLRVGGELKLPLRAVERVSFGPVVRQEAALFVDMNAPKTVMWGQISGGLFLSGLWGPKTWSVALGALLRMPAGASYDIPDRM